MHGYTSYNDPNYKEETDGEFWRRRLGRPFLGALGFIGICMGVGFCQNEWYSSGEQQKITNNVVTGNSPTCARYGDRHDLYTQNYGLLDYAGAHKLEKGDTCDFVLQTSPMGGIRASHITNIRKFNVPTYTTN